MIKDVPLTGVFVNDQQAALEFYTEVVTVYQDAPLA